MKKVLIIGKGWLGSRLENHFTKRSEIKITTTKRRSDSENCISIDFDTEINRNISTNDYDFIVITIPFGRRNSIDELDFRFTQISKFIGNFDKQILLISSTSIYPEANNVIHETTFSDKELNQPYQTIENKLRSLFPQLVIFRLGGLMGDDRYLSKYIQLENNNLDLSTNHIHYQDICNIIDNLIDKEIQNKVYNVVAPEHPTKEEVLEYQINQKLIKSQTKSGKTISSDLLINELNYEFIFPNPLYFKNRAN